ncbi:MAG: hypothetical protein ACJ739_17900 [Acidimicrobiales bacterium]
MHSEAGRHAQLDIPRPKAAMPLVGESLAPWLAASILMSIVAIAFVLTGQQLPMFERAILFLGLFATITSGALVLVRTERDLADSDREERQRPASEALATPEVPMGTAAFVSGMRQWTEAMLELIEHALASTDAASASGSELRAAASDTADLRALLTDGDEEDLSINDLAVIHALCTLWEANQPWVEELAAAADDEWHERWAARHVADRRLRHGGATQEPLTLPYRS